MRFRSGELVKSRLRGKPAPPNTIELEPAVEACARIGAALHSSGLALGPRRSADDELASLRRALAHVERISPELGALLLPHYERVAAAAQQSPALPLCFNHGDFTPGQFLFEGTNSGLIDLDSVCQAEPALDVAQFLTYLTVGGQKSKLSAEDVKKVSTWPSRGEQLSLLVGQILSPGANLVAQLLGPGAKLASQVKKKSEEEEG